MTKEMVSAKVSEKTKKLVDEYAEAEGISRSEAIQRLLDQGLDVQRSDVTVIKGSENEVIPDGGELEDLRRSVESNGQKGRYTFPLIVIGLLWVGVQASTDLPVTLTVLSGLLVAFSLSYAYYVEYLKEVIPS